LWRESEGERGEMRVICGGWKRRKLGKERRREREREEEYDASDKESYKNVKGTLYPVKANRTIIINGRIF